MILENERIQPAFFIQNRDLLIVQRPPEGVGRRVNMRIHETGNRAHRRWWEDSNLRECLAGADNARQPGTADDRDPALSNPRRVA
jgi:hypothetical protein